MCPFRRVDGERAGPAAVGVLVPPGGRTFLIVRPRPLPFDLVLLRPDEPAFHDLAQAEGHAAARQFVRLLEEPRSSRIDTVAAPGVSSWRLQLTVGPFTFLACPREPGRPYRPLSLADANSAAALVAALTPLIAPGADSVQELYTNTHHFGPAE